LETVLWGLLAIGGSVVVSLLGMALVRRSVAVSALEAHSEVAGFVYAVLGVVYGVLMAFVVTVVWDRYDRAETVASLEAGALADLGRLADHLPAAQRAEAQQTLLAYGRVVIDEEWAIMRSGGASPRAQQLADAIWATFGRIEPTNDREAGIYQQALGQLDALSDARGARLLLARSGLPGLMWVVLVVGALVTVGFSFLLAVKSAVAQALIVTTLAASVALVLCLIGALNFPFDGTVHVGPDALAFAMSVIERTAGAAPSGAGR
jgi:hypothetical protein